MVTELYITRATPSYNTAAAADDAKARCVKTIQLDISMALEAQGLEAQVMTVPGFTFKIHSKYPPIIGIYVTQRYPPTQHSQQTSEIHVYIHVLPAWFLHQCLEHISTTHAYKARFGNSIFGRNKQYDRSQPNHVVVFIHYAVCRFHDKGRLAFEQI